MTAENYGYLLVHFREGHDGENIFFSLSRADEPLQWDPLYNGQPVLRSDVGTRGVRDPVIVQDSAGTFHVLATDLCVERDDAPSWEEIVRTGSRNLVIWDSDDLVHWSAPRLVEVAPPHAGMAWAPEVCWDPASNTHLVYWSSRLYDDDDPDHRGDSYSRILASHTADFVTFSPSEVLVDTGYDIIDTTIAVDNGVYHRVSKDENRDGNSLGIHHEVGSGLRSHDYKVVASRIAADRYRDVEGQILVKSHTKERWYLLLDQYSVHPQGYIALESDDIASGDWRALGRDTFDISPGTKHGGILSLTPSTWTLLRLAGGPQ